MNQIKVEIGQYRPVDKGSFKATFSLVIYPEGQKILDCRYFVTDERRWFNFPQKEIKYSDGRKTDYIPLISYLNKEYQENLKDAVLHALKDAKPMEPYAKTNNQSYQRKTNSLPAETSTDSTYAPF